MAQAVMASYTPARAPLSPECLDFGRFRFRTLVTTVQRGVDLLGIEQADVGRRIGDDPEDLRARRLNLFDVVSVAMRHAGVEWRGETISDCDYDRPFRPRHYIHVSGVGAHTAVHSVTLTQKSRTDHPRQGGTRRGATRERNAILAGGNLTDDEALASVAVDRGRINFRDRPIGPAVAREHPDRRGDTAPPLTLLSAASAARPMVCRVEISPSFAAALSFIARCWLGLDEESGVSLAKSEGKCPKNLNSLRSRKKWPEVSDEPM